MIQVGNLSKAYGTQVIFDDITFSVNSGERIGLVGRNGHGKTTLFRIITGEEKPDSGVVGIPADYRVGHLSQNLEFTSGSVLAEACLGLRPSEDGTDQSYRAEAVLMGLGFSADDFSRHPFELSGGFQVRLNLAKLLVSAPDLLLLDEPTNYLDIVSTRWLSGFLKSWKRELMLITHDRQFMDDISTHTVGIHRRKIRKIAGPTDKLYQQVLMEEEIYEQTRINEEKKRRETEQFISRFRAQATRARAVQSKIKALQKKERLEKLSAMDELEFGFISAPFTGKCPIQTKGLSFSFNAEGPPLISDLNLTVGKRDRIAVIGKNGKGKTTFLNLLAGDYKPKGGTVIRHPQLKCAYFGQTNIQRLSSEKTVEQEILDVHPDCNRNAARNICGIMMFEGDSALKKISVLSGGEKSRVLLGKLIVSPSNLLLLDEPTNHLDMESVDSLIEAIHAFEGAVIIVTHSEMILHGVATRLVVFDEGGPTVFEGTYQDFLDRGGWKDEAGGTAIPDGGSGKKNGMKRRDMKRVKAELINERSRILGPLQSEVSRVEEAIIRLEEEIENDTSALIEASVKGDGESIAALSKSLNELRGKIDPLFNELEKLTAEFDARSREFEEKLEAIKTANGNE